MGVNPKIGAISNLVHRKVFRSRNHLIDCTLAFFLTYHPRNGNGLRMSITCLKNLVLECFLFWTEFTFLTFIKTHCLRSEWKEVEERKRKKSLTVTWGLNARKNKTCLFLGGLFWEFSNDLCLGAVFEIYYNQLQQRQQQPTWCSRSV